MHVQSSTAVCSEWSCCEVGVKGKLALIPVYALPCVFPSKLSLYGRSVLCLHRKIGVVVSAHVVLLPHWHSLLQCPCVCLAGWALVNNLSCVFRNDCDALEHFRTIQTAQPISPLSPDRTYTLHSVTIETKAEWHVVVFLENFGGQLENFETRLPACLHPACWLNLLSKSRSPCLFIPC